MNQGLVPCRFRVNLIRFGFQFWVCLASCLIQLGIILGYLGQTPFSEIWRSLGFHFGRSRAAFWKPGDVQMVDFEGPGLTLGSIWAAVWGS